MISPSARKPGPAASSGAIAASGTETAYWASRLPRKFAPASSAHSPIISTPATLTTSQKPSPPA